jgi:hypothetical protein
MEMVKNIPEKALFTITPSVSSAAVVELISSLLP